MKIIISQLEKSFEEKQAVAIDHLDIESNTILGIVGNNGAGKTTLFRLLLDLLKPDAGSVEMTFTKEDKSTFTTKVEVDEEWKTYTGAYIDNSFLIDFLSPEEFFEFIAKVSEKKEEELYEILKEYEPLMNGEILNQKKLIRNMSAGNKQKIGIISALINSPQLLILDEPFNYLDPTSQNNLKKILAEYKQKNKATILISSHNVAHTIDISDRIIIMEKGHIIKDTQNAGEKTKEELEEYFNKGTQITLNNCARTS